MGWIAVLVYSLFSGSWGSSLNVVASFPEQGAEGAWNAIASSILSGPGSTCFGMFLDCAFRALSRDGYEISLPQDIPIFPSFPMIFAGDEQILTACCPWLRSEQLREFADLAKHTGMQKAVPGSDQHGNILKWPLCASLVKA